MSQIESLKTGQKFKKTEAGEIPVEWEVVKIEDCCDILDSERIPLNDEERREIKGEYPYYGANGVVDWINKYIYDEDLILMAEDGGYFDQYETRSIAYLVNGKCWVNNHAHVLRARKGWIREWIFYSIVHKNILPYIGGGTRSKLNQKDLRVILVPAPPLAEQKKIAEILLTVDSAIEKSSRVIEKKKELKKGLMQELLSRGIGHKKFYKAEIGEIPVGWEVMNLGKAVELQGGFAFKSEDYTESGIPLIRISNLTANGIKLDECVYLPEDYADDYQEFSLENDDILVAMSGATTGKIGIVSEEDLPALFNQRVGRFVIKDANYVFKNYLAQVVLTNKFKDALLRDAPGGAQPNVSGENIEKISIALPPLAEQKKIAEMLSNMDNDIEDEIQEKTKLEQLKKGLMQVLLTGKVRVKI